jgi:outer membrane protein OmpU
MSAGFAAADVAVSGSARMGIISTDSNSVMSSRVRISFSGSGTTDSGLAFGGSFDAHNSQGADAGTSGSTFISGAFGKISMGDVAGGDGASIGEIDSAVGYTGLSSRGSNSYVSDGGVGSFGLFGVKAVAATVSTVDGTVTAGKSAVANISGTDGAKVLYTYTTSGITLNASTSQLATNGGASAFGVGASYTNGAITVGVGFGSSDVTIDNVNVVVDAGKTAGGVAITAGELASGKFNGFTGTAKDTTISAGYVMGATTIKASYQVKSLDVTRAADTVAVTGAALADNVLGAVVTVAGLTAATDTTTQAVTALKSAVNAKATATTMGVSVSHKIDAMTINAFGSSTDLDLGTLAASSTRTASGLGVAYDLGGGATIKAGVVNFTTPSLTQTSITQGAHGNLGSGLYAPDTLVAGSVKQTSSNVYDIGISFKF